MAERCTSTYAGTKCAREEGHAPYHRDTEREAAAGVIWGDDSADKPTAEQARALAASIEANEPVTSHFVVMEKLREVQRWTDSARVAMTAGEKDRACRCLSYIEDAARALREEMEASNG